MRGRGAQPHISGSVHFVHARIAFDGTGRIPFDAASLLMGV